MAARVGIFFFSRSACFISKSIRNCLLDNFSPKSYQVSQGFFSTSTGSFAGESSEDISSTGSSRKFVHRDTRSEVRSIFLRNKRDTRFIKKYHPISLKGDQEKCLNRSNIFFKEIKEQNLETTDYIKIFCKTISMDVNRSQGKDLDIDFGEVAEVSNDPEIISSDLENAKYIIDALDKHQDISNGLLKHLQNSGGHGDEGTNVTISAIDGCQTEEDKIKELNLCLAYLCIVHHVDYYNKAVCDMSAPVTISLRPARKEQYKAEDLEKRLYNKRMAHVRTKLAPNLLSQEDAVNLGFESVEDAKQRLQGSVDVVSQLLEVQYFNNFVLDGNRFETLADLYIRHPDSPFMDTLIEEPFFDRTEFIVEFLSAHKKSAIITAPRQSGKTTLIDMLKLFLEVQLDDKGKEYDNIKETPNYHIFSRLRCLNIMGGEHKKFVEEHFGKHPVIHVDFKGVFGETKEEFRKMFRQAIGASFRQHDYLLQRLNSAEDKRLFEKYSSTDQELDHADILVSLGLLARLLVKAFPFSKKPILLVDEYDTPISSVLSSSPDAMFVNSAFVTLFKTLSLVVKDSPIVYKGLMIGILHISGDHSTEVNKSQKCPFLGYHKYSPYFLVSELEVHLFCSDDKQKEEIAEFCGGYYQKNKKQQLFYLQAVLQFLREGKAHFKHSSVNGRLKSLGHLFKVDAIRQKIVNLLNGGSVTFKMEQDITYMNILNMNSMFIPEATVPNTSMLMTYLFHYGLLTHALDSPEDTFRIPNEDMKLILLSIVWQYFANLNIHDLASDYVRCLKTLVQNPDHKNLEILEKALTQLYLALPIGLQNEAGFKSVIYVSPLFAGLVAATEIQIGSSCRPDVAIIVYNTLLAIECKFNPALFDEGMIQAIVKEYLKIIFEALKKKNRQALLNVEKGMVISITHYDGTKTNTKSVTVAVKICNNIRTPNVLVELPADTEEARPTSPAK